MAFDVSTISTWDDEISGGLLKEWMLSNDTIKGGLVELKYRLIGASSKLNNVKITSNAVLAQCATIANTGSTALAQTEMEHTGIEFPQFYCNQTLTNYWTDWDGAKSYNDEKFSFQEYILGAKLESDLEAYDKMIWQGDNGSNKYAAVTGNLTKMRGFFGTLWAYSASCASVKSKTAITSSNALVVVNSIKASIPEVAINDCSLYLSPINFETVAGAIAVEYKYNQNLMNLDSVTEIKVPNTIGLKAVKVNGMSGIADGSAIATPKKNLVLGISDTSDLGLTVWYEKKDRGVWANLRLKTGTGVYFPELAVLVK